MTKVPRNYTLTLRPGSSLPTNDARKAGGEMEGSYTVQRNATDVTYQVLLSDRKKKR